MSNDQWHHIAFSCDAGTFTVVLDGVADTGKFSDHTDASIIRGDLSYITSKIINYYNTIFLGKITVGCASSMTQTGSDANVYLGGATADRHTGSVMAAYFWGGNALTQDQMIALAKSPCAAVPEAPTIGDGGTAWTWSDTELATEDAFFCPNGTWFQLLQPMWYVVSALKWD